MIIRFLSVIFSNILHFQTSRKSYIVTFINVRIITSCIIRSKLGFQGTIEDFIILTGISMSLTKNQIKLLNETTTIICITLQRLMGVPQKLVRMSSVMDTGGILRVLYRDIRSNQKQNVNANWRWSAD